MNILRHLQMFCTLNISWNKKSCSIWGFWACNTYFWKTWTETKFAVRSFVIVSFN